MRFPTQRFSKLRSGLRVLALVLATAGFLLPGATGAKEAGLPAIKRIAADPVSPARATAVLGRGFGAARIGAARTFATAATTPPAEIVELARGLRNDPDLIYEYVHDTLRYTPAFGLRKGPMGTVIDRAGNSFDQAKVMVELLRQAGFTANYVYGTIRLDAAQVTDWLGISDNAQVAEDLFGAAGIPATVAASGAGIAYVDKAHVWVKANIDGTDYVFDPAFKSHDRSAGIDLPAVLGYDAATFYGDAMVGATLTADSVKGVNHANIEGALAAYAGNLVTHIRSDLPAARLEEIVGGAEITPVGAAVRQTSLPYQQSVTAEWTEIPDSYRVSLRVQFQVIDQSFFVDEIYGKPLNLNFAQRAGAPDPVAALILGGDQLQTALPIPQGNKEDLTVTIDNPYAAEGGTYGDETATRALESSFTANYHVAIAMSRPSQHMVEKHQRLLEFARVRFPSEISQSVRDAANATLGFSMLAQLGMAQELVDRISNVETIYHNLVSIVGAGGEELVVDAPAENISTVSLDGLPAEAEGASLNFSGFFSAFEALTIEQIQDAPAVSATGYIAIGSNFNVETYDASLVNWDTIKTQIVNYAAADLALVQSYIDAQYRVIIPKNGNRPIGNFSGFGFYAIKDGTMSPVLSGGSKGAAAAGPVSDEALADGTRNNTRPTDPQTLQSSVDLATGALRMSREDYSVGAAGFPYGLNFQRSYDSADWWRKGPLGRGWSHNYDIWVDDHERSSGFQALGQDSPVDAAAAIAALLVGQDLLAAGDSVDRVTISTVIHEWLAARLYNNIVVVMQPGPDMVFTKLADGSFNPPPGQVATIEKQPAGSYVLTLKDQTRLTFQEANSPYLDDPTQTIHRLVTWANPNGFEVTLSYSANRLAHVVNDHGWVLQFRHTSLGRISEVNDGSDREVKYDYSGLNNELSAFKYPGSIGFIEYDYDYDPDLPGHLTEVRLPTDGTNPALRIAYDALGRVKEQRGARDFLWQYFYGGGRASKADPLGNEQVVYFDERRLPVQTVDALGNSTHQAFDGLLRLTRTVLPEGNSLEYLYDANHNVRQITANPKPGSSLAPIVRSFVYDQTWNKPTSATDALGRTTDYVLDPANGNLKEVRGPAVGGLRPTTLYSYRSDGQVETVTDPTGKVTHHAYTTAAPPLTKEGMLASITEDDGGLALTTGFGYDLVGNLTEITDPRGNGSFAEYDGERRLTHTYGPGSLFNIETRTRFEYDTAGRLRREKRDVDGADTSFQTTVHTYDAAGNRITTKVPGNHTTTFDYDELERLKKTTDPEGRSVETVYDALGRVARVVETTDLVAGTTQDRVTHSYTANGKLETLSDAKGNTTTYLYDGFDRLERTTFPDLTYEELTYDANGNIKTRRTRAGELFAYDYDALNRLEREDVPYSTIDITFTYDLAGRSLTVTDAAGSITNTYDGAGRLETVTSADNKTLTYGYDAAGNRTRLTWPDGWYVTYDYDGLDRITDIRENGSVLLAHYDYDFLSRRTGIGFGDSTSAAFDFVTADNDLRGIDHSLPGGLLAFDYTYNANDERTGLTVSDDLYLWRPDGAANESYTPNNLNQYSAVGGVLQVYDSNGNLTDDGYNAFTFDAKNRLLTAVNPQHTASYAYDALDRRVAKTVDTLTTKYLLDGAMEVAEYDGATDALLLRYVYGPGMTAPVAEISAAGARRYLHPDAIGSVVAVTGGGGGGGSFAAKNPQTGTGSIPGYAIEAGDDRVLLVAVTNTGFFSVPTPTVSYGGAALSLVATRLGTTERVSLFQLPESAIGAGAQSADLTASVSGAKLAAFHLEGVDQTRLAAETAGATGGSGSVSANLTTGSDGTVVVSAFGLPTAGFTPWAPAGAEEVEVAYLG